MSRAPAIVVTAEHGGARVPTRYAALFRSRDARRALASHRGWDPGTAALARSIGRALGTRPFVATTTRLLCDFNRSLHHRRLFSEFTRDLARTERENILARHWHPHRARVEAAVAAGIARTGRVVHLAIHSFTPVLEGEVRTMDVAWLYDPARRFERELVERWRAGLRARRPDLVTARNRPYTGTADGFTTHLRRQHGDRVYSGIELEVNQRFPLGELRAWRELRRDLVGSLASALA